MIRKGFESTDDVADVSQSKYGALGQTVSHDRVIHVIYERVNHKRQYK